VQPGALGSGAAGRVRLDQPDFASPLLHQDQRRGEANGATAQHGVAQARQGPTHQARGMIYTPSLKP
jgi:hypothetical protein